MEAIAGAPTPAEVQQQAAWDENLEQVQGIIGFVPISVRHAPRPGLTLEPGLVPLECPRSPQICMWHTL